LARLPGHDFAAAFALGTVASVFALASAANAFASFAAFDFSVKTPRTSLRTCWAALTAVVAASFREAAKIGPFVQENGQKKATPPKHKTSN
jgi:hypothetical protein